MEQKTETGKKRGGQPGNKNGSANRPVAALITKMLLEKDDGAAMKNIIGALTRKAEEGDTDAARFLIERIEGKPLQPVAADVNQNITVKLIQFGEKP